MRTHHCSQIRNSDVGSSVTLIGWVHTARDHGGVIFIDLRDREGLTQIVFRPEECGEAAKLSQTLRSEDVISVQGEDTIDAIVSHMKDVVDFGEQVQFDTLTWGKRHIGSTKCSPYLKVELFELFDDPFVMEQFRRRRHMLVPTLKVETYVPTAEDVIVQKLRWARDKDLSDALDVLIVQEPKNLDMDYVRHWCCEHGSESRLGDALAKIPEDEA